MENPVDRRRCVSRKSVPGKPPYLPPPPPTPESEQAGAAVSSLAPASPKPAKMVSHLAPFDRPRSQTTRIIIKEGKKVSSEQAFDFSGLENSQSIALLDAFKKGKITKDQTVQFAKQITAANRSNNTEYIAHLFQSLSTLPEKEKDRPRSQTVAPGSQGLPTHVLEKLDDVQRKAILTSVAAGRLSIDEALGLVRDFYNAETRVSTSGSPESPARITPQVSEEDVSRLCDAIGRTYSDFEDRRKSTIPQASLLSHFGLDDDDDSQPSSAPLSPATPSVAFPPPAATTTTASDLLTAPHPIAPPRRNSRGSRERGGTKDAS